jgi:GNAT superfamily N-acetyltransferase
MVEIRPYVAADRIGLLACIAELQDHEVALEADRLPGTAIAETHLAYLLDQCRQKRGAILVAVNGAEVLGFACVWADEDFGEHYAVPARAAHLSDLVVRAPHRRGGLGHELTRAAERFARLARSFYAASGFREYELVVTKPLADLSGGLAESNAAPDPARQRPMSASSV